MSESHFDSIESRSDSSRYCTPQVEEVRSSLCADLDRATAVGETRQLDALRLVDYKLHQLESPSSIERPLAERPPRPPPPALRRACTAANKGPVARPFGRRSRPGVRRGSSGGYFQAAVSWAIAPNGDPRPLRHWQGVKNACGVVITRPLSATRCCRRTIARPPEARTNEHALLVERIARHWRRTPARRRCAGVRFDV